MDGHDNEEDNDCEDFIVESTVYRLEGHVECYDMGTKNMKASNQSDNNIVPLEQVIMEKLKLGVRADDPIESGILDH